METIAEVKQQISKLLDDLNKGVYEKQEVIALTLLTAIAGESIFLLGAPGVAKSLIARRLKFAFKDGSSFEYLMNRFSTPDELFGPVSISQLRDHDKYERNINNYLPGATVVFLDEIWKAGPSIQNALLTVLNEKIYRNGEQEIRVPIKALISASNELPLKGEGLEALWDRFLVRYVVEGISDRNNFNEMISKSLKSYEDNVALQLKITDTSYTQWSGQIDMVEIPENIFNVIHIIRGYLDLHNNKEEQKEAQIYISDRRWRKIVRLLRTSAFLNGRKAIDLMDCFLIAHCIWNEPYQLEVTRQFVKEAIYKHGYKPDIDLKELQTAIEDFDREVREETSSIKPVQKEEPKVFNNEYLKIREYNGYFIKASDYKNLKVNEKIRVDLYDRSGDRFIRQTTEYCIKGSEMFNILAYSYQYDTHSKRYSLETEKYEEQIITTRKPHYATKKHWDKEAAKLLTLTNNFKVQLEHYRQNDLQHLRNNLFVKPSFAEIVESNLINTKTEIEKLEVKIKEIQHYYETIDEKTKIKNKQLTNGIEHE